MADIDAIDERLRAVERALTDGDHEHDAALADAADLAARLEVVEERLDAAEERLDDLDAGLQAVRGYVGNVRSVNRDVEQRADAALAKSEALERRLESAGGRADRGADGGLGSDAPEPKRGREPGGGVDDSRVADEVARDVMASGGNAADQTGVGGATDGETFGEHTTDESERPAETERLYRRGQQRTGTDRGDDEGRDGLLGGLRDRL